MKILSYNLYGVKNTNYPILNWKDRQKNILNEGSDHIPIVITITD